MSYFETATQLPPCAVATFHDVSWDEYERLLEQVGEAAGLRISYNDGTLEVITLSPEHESYARFFESLMTVIRLRLRLNVRSFGSTTMRTQKKRKGNEPDACFYVQSAAVIGNKMRIDFAVDPPPDIVVDVDIQHNSQDKSSIYGALGVPEIWRYDGNVLILQHLENDQYVEVENSLALPLLSAPVLTGFLNRLLTEGELQTLVAFDEWIQSQKE